MSLKPPTRRGPPLTAKVFVTVAAVVLIAYLVVAGTIARSINFTAIALALVTLLGAIWGNPMNRGPDDD